MYRSAEIALERGYDAFRLLEIGGFSKGRRLHLGRQRQGFLTQSQRGRYRTDQATTKVKISRSKSAYFKKARFIQRKT